jgi:2-iminobutanoate/2-iminopropanoate deaminase
VSDHRRPVHADGAPAAIGAYSHAVVSNGLLFCSGQIPLDPATGELVEGGAGDQTRRCLDNLAAVCVAGGTTLADAVRVTVYAEDLAGDWAEINDAYSAYFGELAPPARAAVGVAALPRGARVEIDAVVALPD